MRCRCRDHPRLRGEHSSFLSFAARPIGSPPPTRGALQGHHGSAGRCADHPRLRGEHFAAASSAFLKIGSPPPTRGARGDLLGRPGHDRITPAYAGSTEGIPVEAKNGPGSPPPTRGAHTPYPDRMRGFRITPAYAGSTGPQPRRSQRPTDHPRLRGEHLQPNQRYHPHDLRKDHPRLRGEHVRAEQLKCAHPGSPPPTRGAPNAGLNCRNTCGITPAYAGSTCSRRGSVVGRSDHPRLRGEHARRRSHCAATFGSPPPTRGAHHFRRDRAFRVGITPAYAGST